jgi:hypothetical protein
MIVALVGFRSLAAGLLLGLGALWALVASVVLAVVAVVDEDANVLFLSVVADVVFALLLAGAIEIIF